VFAARHGATSGDVVPCRDGWRRSRRGDTIAGAYQLAAMTRPLDRSGALASDTSDLAAPVASADATPGDRLDSWKEIAAFLQRDVRTVQRWEKHAGLPVHRHADARLRSAYAYRSELDAWWRAQEARQTETLVPSAPPEAFPAVPRLVTRRVAVVAVVLLIAAAIAVGSRLAVPAPKQSAAAPGSVSVLLARIESEPGDLHLVERLEKAVARGLAMAPGIQTVGPPRVGRTLRLMRRPLDTPLTQPVALEVAVRDTQVQFIIAGRLRRLPQHYLLELEALNPADSVVKAKVGYRGTVDELAEEAESQLPGLAPTLAAAASATPATAPMERVTTASLPALRLYTAAVHAGTRRQWAAAELLARRALASDPQFAAAYAWLAWAMRQQGSPVSASVEAAKRALDLASDLPEREDYFIIATYHALTGNLPDAIAAYEALRELHPADPLALDMLLSSYSRAGRMKAAVELSLVRADANPRDFYANVRAAHALTIWQTDAKRASPFADRARDLADRPAQNRPGWIAWIGGLPVFRQWLDEQPAPAVTALRQSYGMLEGRAGRERDAFATALGFSFLAFGRVQESTRAFRQASSPMRQLDLAIQALALRREAEARRWLQQIDQHGATRPAVFARAGLTREAEQGLSASPPSEYIEGIAEVTRGIVAAKRGRTDLAIPHLRGGLDLLRVSGELEYFLAAEALAGIWLDAGDTDRAIAVLRDAAAQRRRTYVPGAWSGAYWLKMQVDLAQILRRVHRFEEASGVERTIAATLQSADADHPFRIPLSRDQRSSR
jgi:tetratricopeptide (TPR) repeat protein